MMPGKKEGKQCMMLQTVEMTTRERSSLQMMFFNDNLHSYNNFSNRQSAGEENEHYKSTIY
jgi:hypothetical protein